jgi:hypothetical protein
LSLSDSRPGFGRKREVEGDGPSLREIATGLSTPARSGMVLTKERIAAIAADLSLPAGFSERSQMLVNMFRAAAELDSLPALLAALGAEADRWYVRYAEWAAEYPSSAPIWQEWRERLAATRALLAGMAVAASSPVEAIEPKVGQVMPEPVDDQAEYAD